MADTFAVINFTVPTTDTTVSYTDPAISGWDTGGIAIFCISGNTDDEGENAHLSYGFADSSGNLNGISGRVMGTGTTTYDSRRFMVGGNTTLRIVDADPFPHANGYWTDMTFNAALDDGITVDWTLDPDLTPVDPLGSRVLEGFVILIGGLANSLIGTTANTSAVTGTWEADAVLSWASQASFATTSQDNHTTGIGGVVNDGADTQHAVGVMYDRGTLTPEQVARTVDYATSITAAGAAEVRTASGFDSAGWDSAGVLANYSWAAMEFTDTRLSAVALETLSGQTGSTSFTGLAIDSMIVLGAIVGNTSDDTVQTGTNQDAIVVFATDGTSTYSVSMGAEGVNPVTAFSRFSDGTVDMVAGDGTTRFDATVTSLAGGITLNISTGMSGRMFLFGIEMLELADGASSTVNISESTGVGFGESVAGTVNVSESIGTDLIARDVDSGPMQDSA